jgi:hypothetical protein
MDLQKQNQYLQSSSARLNSGMELYEKAGAPHTLVFLRKEAWIHLKRSVGLWWHLMFTRARRR